MIVCTCTPTTLPGGAKLRTVDELGRPIVESLHRVSGGRVLRARATTVEDRVKVTVSECADASGDVAVDADGARLIYPGTVGRQGAEVAVPRALQRATWAAAIRAVLERRWQDRGPEPSPTCSTCGNEVPFRDHSPGASHREPNEVILRTPRGFFARVRAVLLETGPDATSLPIHLTVAHAIDASGDVVKGEGGAHRIVDCGVHNLHVDQAEVDWATGKPTLALNAALADMIVTEVLPRLEGAILARTAYEKVAFLRRPPPPAG